MSEQKLNSLSQFRKRSSRLLLEEHHGCEVPAGCGGVVMRWRNPLEARPLRIHLLTTAASAAWIDGEVLTLGRADLRPSRHVLAIEIGEVNRVSGLLMAALQHDPLEKPREDAPPAIVEPPLCVLSAADDSWLFTLQQPADNWRSLDFDDSAWTALVDLPIPEIDWSQPNGYQWQSCHRANAAALGIPRAHEGAASHGRVWVRKVFEIPQPTNS
jgi:hypothetical protein